MYDQHLPEINSKERGDSRMTEKHVVIHASLVRRLIASQFPIFPLIASKSSGNVSL